MGDFINRGLALNNTGLILLGAIPAAILALILDATIGFVEALIRPGRLPTSVKRKAALFFGILGLLVLLTLGMIFSTGAKKAPPIRVGSKNFTEQLILGELFAQKHEGTFSLLDVALPEQSLVSRLVH